MRILKLTIVILIPFLFLALPYVYFRSYYGSPLVYLSHNDNTLKLSSAVPLGWKVTTYNDLEYARVTVTNPFSPSHPGPTAYSVWMYREPKPMGNILPKAIEPISENFPTDHQDITIDGIPGYLYNEETLLFTYGGYLYRISAERLSPNTFKTIISKIHFI